MSSNIVFTAEKTEISEQMSFSIRRSGWDTWDASLPWDSLSDCITTLTSAFAAAPGTVTRGLVYQVRNVAGSHRPQSKLQWLDTDGSEYLLSIHYDELPLLASVLADLADFEGVALDLDMTHMSWRNFIEGVIKALYSPSPDGEGTVIEEAVKDQTQSVTSVNGMIGDVVIDKNALGLSEVDNTSDENKPLSVAAQSALDTKIESLVAGSNITVDSSDPRNPVINSSGGGGGSGGAVSSVNSMTGDVVITKGSIGLGLVNNTSDANKPISTAVAAVLNGRLSESSLDDEYAPKGYAVSTLVPGTDITAELNALLLTGSYSRYSRLAIMPGTYYYSDTIRLDVSRWGLFAPYEGVDFVASSSFPLDDRPAFEFYRSSQVGQRPAIACPWQGIILTGPAWGSATVGIRTTGVPVDSVANFSMKDYLIRDFGVGLQFMGGSYCITSYQGCIRACREAVSTPPGQAELGERMTFVGCTIYACNLAIRQRSQVRYHMIACSIDYCQQVLVQETHGSTNFVDCHIENEIGNTSQALPWFVVEAGSVFVNGGVVNCSTRSGPGIKYLVENNTDPISGQKVEFKDVLIYGMSNPEKKFASGTGLTTVNSVRSGSNGSSGQQWVFTSDAANLFGDPSASQTNLVDDWFISQGAGAVEYSVGKLEDSYQSIESTAVSGISGRMFRYTKKSTSSGVIEVWVPVQALKMYMMGFEARRTGDITGTIYATWVYARNSPVGRPGVITRSEQLFQNSMTQSNMSNTDTWYSRIVASGVPKRAPGWATHVVLRLSASNPSNVLLRNITVNEV